ncbi:AlbA family DNA-binding domain-containing protein [Aliikangiella coralliicola]|uniref:ATP-binding protein n=1 Tax=Aliikangiella coralliicola TaxID=2592383 RepID=A0A545TSQ6_9GAMM|nr:ATP-binding protein [Aliikangiella coralliicola]TQV80248.1 ATP-binding protein [Aliikangiella coralliicola]
MFSKPVSSITTEDLQNLLEERAVENVRLEFKQEAPSKNEMLKKLSSFANTFGGYLIVGVAEESDGTISSIPGIDPRSDYKQTINSWCFGGVSAPLNVEVSEPIPSPEDPDKACYVIYVAESDLAPHFINGRKGCYVRTDEQSQLFKAKLATQDEFLSMLERRKVIHSRKKSIVDRARTRFNTYVDSKYSDLGTRNRGIGARLSMAIVPRFPSKPVVSQLEALDTIKNRQISWRQVNFPRRQQGHLTQNDSALVLFPASVFSIMEFNIWGLMFYAMEIQEEYDEYSGIHLYQFLGNICVFLRHAKMLMASHDINLDMSIELDFEGIRGVPWIYARTNNPVEGPSSLLDDRFGIKLDVTAADIKNRSDGVAMELLDNILFSMNWPELVGDREQLRELLQQAYRFNFWDIPSEFSE